MRHFYALRVGLPRLVVLALISACATVPASRRPEAETADPPLQTAGGVDGLRARAVAEPFAVVAHPLYGTELHRWLDEDGLVFTAGHPGRQCVAVALPAAREVAHAGCFPPPFAHDPVAVARRALVTEEAVRVSPEEYWPMAMEAALHEPPRP